MDSDASWEDRSQFPEREHEGGGWWIPVHGGRCVRGGWDETEQGAVREGAKFAGYNRLLREVHHLQDQLVYIGRRSCAGLMSGQRRRHWPAIKPAQDSVPCLPGVLRISLGPGWGGVPAGG